ncbi:hypothetical protein PENSPDRAFT_652318 [Peniophora sp. CONT]|nr:hypothetical protein PENSPDRAFT_652318 [Peniophora sp. CONT]
MPCESIAKYRPGGLHPVTLGTIICSPTARYRVVQKLGVGGFSTVWLVEILGTPGIAAMRISSAQSTPPGQDDVLRHIAMMESPPAHFVAIFDRFKMEGPNGTHEVIVMEILAPVTAALYWMTGCFRPSSAVPNAGSSGMPGATQGRTSAAATRKAITRSLVEAVSEMHAAGIVHGDLHMCNVGLELAGLASGSDRNKRYIKRTPETTVVLPLDPILEAYSSHWPPYIVEPWNFSSYLRDLGTDQLTPVVKIFDFGSGPIAWNGPIPRPASSTR